MTLAPATALPLSAIPLADHFDIGLVSGTAIAGQGLPRHLARLKDLLNPGFIRANAYACLLHHRGLLCVLMSLEAQFDRRCRRSDR